MNILAAFGFNDLLLPDHVGRKRKVLRSGCGRGWLFALFPGRLFDRLNGGSSLGSCRFVSWIRGNRGRCVLFGGCCYSLALGRSGYWCRLLGFRFFRTCAGWVV